MATWITPIYNRQLSDVVELQTVKTRLNPIFQNSTPTDIWFWLYGDYGTYSLYATDGLLLASDGYIYTHGEEQSIRGAWNCIDINRVIDNTIYVRDYMQSIGFPVSFPDQVHCVVEDLPTKTSVMYTCKSNILTLIASFYGDYPEIDVTKTTFNYEDANALELTLWMLKDGIERMINSLLYCGTFYSGDTIML